MTSTQRPAYGAYHSRPPFGRAKSAAMRPWNSSTPQPGQDLPVADGHFKIGRVFRRLFAMLGPNAITILALIALAAIPERVVVHLLGYDGKYTDVASRTTLILSGLALQLAMIRLALDAFAGQRSSFAACVQHALRSYLPVIAVGALTVIPLVAGALLLGVPGVMLGTAWSMAAPVKMVEGAGIIACLKRSAALTHGHRWKIFGSFFVLGFVLAFPMLALLPVWHMPLAAHAEFTTANWLARLIFSAGLGLVVASVYFELRQAEAVKPMPA